MSPLDERELERLLADLESDRVERKESAADANSLRRNICALANDLPAHGLPGVVLIGVDDDGGCADLTINDKLLTKLAGLKDDGTIMPIPSLVVQKHSLFGCEVAAIVVEPSRSPPVRFRGRVWVRVGPTVRQATPEEEQRLTERRLRVRGPSISGRLRTPTWRRSNSVMSKPNTCRMPSQRMCWRPTNGLSSSNCSRCVC